MQFQLCAWALLAHLSSWGSALVTQSAPQSPEGDYLFPSVFRVLEFFCLTLDSGECPILLLGNRFSSHPPAPRFPGAMSCPMPEHVVTPHWSPWHTFPESMSSVTFPFTAHVLLQDQMPRAPLGESTLLGPFLNCFHPLALPGLTHSIGLQSGSLPDLLHSNTFQYPISPLQKASRQGEHL